MESRLKIYYNFQKEWTLAYVMWSLQRDLIEQVITKTNTFKYYSLNKGFGFEQYDPFMKKVHCNNINNYIKWLLLYVLFHVSE
jgi:hypothetical protein